MRHQKAITIFFSLFLSFFAFSGFAFAADTCPGSDINNPYMCGAADEFTCDDQWGSQIRTINCYPPDSFIANDGTACPAPGNTEYFAVSGGCASTSYGSAYTCQPTDYFGCRYRYIDVGGCSVDWSLEDDYQFSRVSCYPDTVYGAWEPMACTSDAMCGTGYVCGTSGYCTEEMTCPNFGLERSISYNLQDEAYAYGYAVATDNANNAYVAGEQYSPVTGLDMYVIKYDPAGNIVWTRTYDVVSASGSGNESGYGIAVNPDGSAVYVAGRQQDASSLNSDIFIQKYNGTDGSLDISFGTGGTIVYGGSGADIARTAALDSSGNIYVGGYQQTATGDVDAALLSYTPTGSPRSGFPVIYGGLRNQSIYGIAISGGDVYVTGYEQPDAVNADMFLRKYTIAGALSWVQTYNSGGIQSDIGYGVAIASTGDVYVTGYQETNGGDIFYRKYTSGGSLIVGDSYNSGGNQNDVGRGIVTGNTSRIFIAGRQQVNNEDAYLGEFYALHTKILKNFLHRGDLGSAPEYNEIAYGIAATPSTVPAYASTANDVYVVGYEAEGGGGMFLNKYSCSAASSPAFGMSTVANFHVSPQTGTAPLLVKADARATAGNIVKYEWDWNYNGTTFVPSSDKSAVVTHTYPSNGVFVVALRVTDTKGLTDVATVSVTVNPNTAPIVAFETCDLQDANCIAAGSGTPFTGPLPLRVNVNGAASSDPDPTGSIVSFSWDWGDGTVDGSGERTTHTYSAAGTYTITLTVTDNGGLTDIPPPTQQTIIVTAEYVCSTACSGATPVCGPGVIEGTTQCLACLADNDCGIGYQCLGTSCRQGTQCPDGSACPFDGQCRESVSCDPLALGATCPDGSACPASGVCPATKYQCVLSSDAVDTQCYVEEFGGCLVDGDCQAGITGGKCIGSPGVCRYAKCLNTTGFSCTNDNECAEGDGTCNAGVCNYVYDCAYGPGMGGGASGLYAAASPDAMPAMPIGVQADGQACTKPTPDAPNNCEGINGCLYYNYNPDGTPIASSNNSVGTCINAFQGGTGCVYYQYFNGTTQTEKVNCLPRYGESTTKSPHAGIPNGCFVMDKGKTGKEYDCSAIDGCYYYLDGRVDCRYKNVTAEPCTTATVSTACVSQPLAAASCNASNFCEYSGNGCIYEPDPKGAIACPGATLAATGGDNFVQCLLNKDAGLPGFLLSAAGDLLSACVTNIDCPLNNICINGTCYPQCQANTDCVTGDQCTTTCSTSLDCTGSLVCSAGICVPPTACVPGTICPNGELCPANGICPTEITKCSGAFPSTSPVDATTVTIGLTTNTSQLCNYDPSLFVTYATMLYKDVSASIGHSITVPSHNGLNIYYAQCYDPAFDNYSPVCAISYTQGCSSSTIGADCLTASGTAGTCGTSTGGTLECTPICSGATPKTPPNLTEGMTSVTLGLTTDTAQTCSYGTSPITITSAFDVTGGTTHSEPGVPTHDGKNVYYAQCFDSTLSEYSPVCSIPFDQGCSSSTIGAACLTTGGTSGTCGTSTTGTIMCIPVCSGAIPVTPPNFAAGTTSVTIGLDTDTAQTCKYSTLSSAPYASMTTFTTTGGMTHSASASSHDGKNAYYAQCYDAAEDAYSSLCSIPFDQDFPCPPGTSLDLTSGTCISACVPGTMCVYGGLCPTTGICCPGGTTYNAATGNCDTCEDTTAGCGAWVDWCVLHPTSAPCISSGCTNPEGCTPILSSASCNTLGYTFTNTAVTASGNCDLVAIILALLSWMAWVIALLAVLSGLRAGYLYITAMGNEKNLILAKRYLIYTTIGVAVSVLTFSIVAITRAILNI